MLSARRPLPLLIYMGLVLLAGCGSTVPLRNATAPQSDQGLFAAPTGAAPSSTTRTGPSTPQTAGGVTSAGGSSDPSESKGSSATPGGLPGSGSAKAKTIQIGLLDAGSPGAAITALGGSGNEFTLSAKSVGQALVHYYNSHGGIAGRQIDMVEYTMSVTDSNYEVQFAAACADFTQDHHVAVALTGGATFYSASYESCLNKAHTPDIQFMTGGTDAADLARFPMMFTPTTPSLNRSYSALLRGLVKSRFLSPATKIGVIVENCPFNTRTYANTIEGTAKSLGLQLLRRDVSCAVGFGDVGSFEAQVSSAVLPFRTAGVSRVMFVTGYQALAVYAFEQQAHSQGYSPSYAFTSNAGIPGAASEFTADAMSRMAGVGWSPIMDVTSRKPTTAANRRCLSVLASEGIRLSSKGDDQAAAACELFFVLEAGLKRASGNSSSEIVAGLNSLRTDYQSPFNLAAATNYRPGHHDGPRLFATFAYRPGCSCFEYTTPPTWFG